MESGPRETICVFMIFSMMWIFALLEPSEIVRRTFGSPWHSAKNFAMFITNKIKSTNNKWSSSFLYFMSDVTPISNTNFTY